MRWFFTRSQMTVAEVVLMMEFAACVARGHWWSAAVIFGLSLAFGWWRSGRNLDDSEGAG